MTLLLNNAVLVDPDAGTEFTGAVKISSGKIDAILTQDTEIKEEMFRTRNILDCEGKVLAPGIVDLGVKICEPGERHKESYRTAGRAAAAGGVTTVITRPDTTPVIDSPEQLEFIARRALVSAPIKFHPMAALTKGMAGREMAEVGLMLDAGAVAFNDCDHVVSDTKIFARCLTYARSLGALVVAHPQDPGLSKGAAATSGKFASLRGLPAASPIAERLGLERDLALVEMTGARYHADNLSSAMALGALERAKAAGVDATAGVNIHHLTLNELDVGDYRTFYKLKPPLRSEEDRQAMIEAVGSGLIDIISSMHTPQDEESKRRPFEEAASGAVGLQTLLPAALRLYHSGQLSLPQLFRAMSLNPAKRIGLDSGRMEVGAPADLLLFDPNAPFVLDRFKLHSKSKNTPFDGARMQGRVLKTWVGGQEVFSAS